MFSNFTIKIYTIKVSLELCKQTLHLYNTFLFVYLKILLMFYINIVLLSYFLEERRQQDQYTSVSVGEKIKRTYASHFNREVNIDLCKQRATSSKL